MNQSTQEKHFSYILGILTFNIIMQIGSFGSAMDIPFSSGILSLFVFVSFASFDFNRLCIDDLFKGALSKSVIFHSCCDHDFLSIFLLS
jgi:uncharacterized membrane protein